MGTFDKKIETSLFSTEERAEAGPALPRGSVLIMVVWMVMLLSIFVAALGSRGAFALQVAARFEGRLHASYLARGGVEHIVMVLARDPSPEVDGFNDEWINNEPLFLQQPLGDGTFTVSYSTVTEVGVATSVYGVVDEERKLNLNTATEEMLHALLHQVGLMREDVAMVVAQAVADWRDEDQEPRPMGAEDFYYQGLSPGYACKDQPFESVEELRLVKGMSPKAFRAVAPYLTVYGSGQVNINTASRAVLRALALSETGISGVVFYRAGEDNKEQTADDRAVGATAAIASELSSFVPAEDANRLRQLMDQQLLTVQSEAFGFSIVGQTDSGKGDVRITGVVDREGTILAWTEE